METIKNAFKSVNKLGLLSLVLVAFSTMAFTAPAKQTNVKWTQTANGWEVVPSESYFCDDLDATCTRTYPVGQNPNTNPSNPIAQEDGLFIPL